MEVVKHVPGKASHPVGQRWLVNNRPSYSWYRSFLERHKSRISSRVVENLDPKRWKVSLPAVESLYKIMQMLIQRYPGLPASNVCNLDETNLTPERRKSRVLAARGARRTHTLCNEARFSMTCLPVVFADGTYMPPHFIVKGKKRPRWWGSPEYQAMLASTVFAEASLSVQDNGWMDTVIFLTWFQEKFLPFTADRRSAVTPVILVLDNFSGHVHPEVLQKAKDNHVIMVGLPPHSTHITQPLDVTLMKPLKDYWSNAITSLQVKQPWERYTEQDVIKLLCEPTLTLGVQPENGLPWSPWSKAFTPANIKSAFATTGLWPIDFEKASFCGAVQCNDAQYATCCSADC